MIYNALNTTIAKLNEFIKSRFNIREDQLELCNLLEQDGNLAAQDSSKIIATLVNVERETAMGVTPSFGINQNNKHIVSNPPVNLNMYVLFTTLSGGKNYPEAIKFLSSVIEFFQGTLALTHQNAPSLHKDIEKISFEMVNLDFHALSQLWGSLGAKYMPSVLYKLRMVSIDQKLIKTEVETTSSPEPSLYTS